jgi:hypothetical protein
MTENRSDRRFALPTTNFSQLFVITMSQQFLIWWLSYCLVLSEAADNSTSTSTSTLSSEDEDDQLSPKPENLPPGSS